MCKYWQRNNPVGGVGIGTWLDFLEAASMIGIVFRLAIIYCTSENYVIGDGSPEFRMIVAVVMIGEVLMLTFKLVLTVAVPKEPAWVREERRLIRMR